VLDENVRIYQQPFSRLLQSRNESDFKNFFKVLYDCTSKNLFRF